MLFLQRAATEFSALLDGSSGTLESAAVMRSNAVELVPVDLQLPTAELRPKFDEMAEGIAAISHRTVSCAVQIQPFRQTVDAVQFTETRP